MPMPLTWPCMEYNGADETRSTFDLIGCLARFAGRCHLMLEIILHEAVTASTMPTKQATPRATLHR
eukprot:COSAG03_NODE_2414_length_2793_cov_10.466444_3_plen_66_part_00